MEELEAYLAAGATAVGLGGQLVGSVPPRTAADLDAIAARAARAVRAADRRLPGIGERSG